MVIELTSCDVGSSIVREFGSDLYLRHLALPRARTGSYPELALLGESRRSTRLNTTSIIDQKPLQGRSLRRFDLPAVCLAFTCPTFAPRHLGILHRKRKARSCTQSAAVNPADSLMGHRLGQVTIVSTAPENRMAAQPERVIPRVFSGLWTFTCKSRAHVSPCDRRSARIVLKGSGFLTDFPVPFLSCTV